MVAGEPEVHLLRTWEDAESDWLTVSVENSGSTLERFTVFTGSCVWLNKQQVLDLRAYLSQCLVKMGEGDEIDKAVALD